MKIYISADMEGITGVSHWDEVSKNHGDYPEFQKQMSKEVAAACDGAFSSGATEIWVKDAHDSGRNILQSMLPENTNLIRGWSGNPFSMMQELDDSFDAGFMIGYHSRAGSGGNPLAHTMSSSKLERIWINDIEISEFLLHGYLAATLKVPIILVTGDEQLIEEVNHVNPCIGTVAVKKGVGDSTVNMCPNTAVERIYSAAKLAMGDNFMDCLLPTMDNYQVKIRFIKQQTAYRASHYPGAFLLDDKTIQFETTEYINVMRLVQFTT